MLSLPLYIETNNLDILLLQETKIDEHDLEYLQFKLPHMHLSASIGNNRSRGVLTLIRKNTFSMEKIEYPEDLFESGRLTCVKITADKLTFTLMNVYAPVESNPRLEFFVNLHEFMQTLEGPFILGGDWNCTLLPSDRLPPRQLNLDQSCRQLLSIIEGFELIDAHQVKEDDPTFFTYRKSGSYSRLDRIYFSNSMHPLLASSEQIVSLGSDHEIAPTISLRNCNTIKQGNRQWRLKNEILEDPIADLTITDILGKPEELMRDNSPALANWLNLKNFLRQTLMQLSKNLRRKWFARKAQLESKYLKALESVKRNNGNTRSTDTLAKLTTEMVEYSRNTLQQKIEKATMNRNNWNNSTRKSLFSLFKSQSSQVIPGLKPPAEEYTEDTPKMLQHVNQFYTNLYAEPVTSPPSTFSPPTIPQERKFPEGNLLQAPFTDEEILKVIKSLPNCKSPGPDGLTNEFYKKYSSVLAPILAKTFNSIMLGEHVHEEFSYGLVVLIFKKGDPQLLSNYRPITLLNADYKILTKTISWRLRDYIGNVVGPFQYGFIPGRRCEDNAMTLQLAIDHIQSGDKTEESGLLFLDMEKAYDRVSHQWLFSCLEMVNFPPLLLSMVKDLYASAKSSILLNNFKTNPISMKCGVRQGDALSCILFNISLIPLTWRIESCMDYKGIKINSSPEVKFLYYADDAVFLFRTYSSLLLLENLLNTFCQASNSRVNITKSELLVYGENPTSSFVASNPEKVRHLGYWFNKQGLITASNFWNYYIPQLRSTLSFFNRPGLSITAKRMLFCSCILPKITYRSKLHPPGVQDTRKLTSMMFQFIYSDRKVNVRQDLAEAPLSNGGMAIPNLQMLFHTQRIEWIYRYFAEPTGLWQQMLNAYLQSARVRTSNWRLPWLPFSQTTDKLYPLPPPWNPILHSWKHFSGRIAEPIDFETLLEQPVFENDFLNLPKVYSGLRQLFQNGISTIGQLWDPAVQSWYIPQTPNRNNTTSKRLDNALERIVLTLDYWTDLPSTANSCPGLTAHELCYDGQSNFILLKDFRFGICYRTAVAQLSSKAQLQHSIAHPVISSTEFPITAKRLWQLVWHSWKPRKLAEFSWKLHQNGLAIGKRLIHILPEEVHDTLKCSHCRCMQTADHLFFECPLLQPTFRKLHVLANKLWPTLQLKSLPWTRLDFMSIGFVSRNLHLASWNLLYSNFLYEIWKQHNNSVYQGTIFSYQAALYDAIVAFTGDLRRVTCSLNLSERKCRSLQRALGPVLFAPDATERPRITASSILLLISS
jgi:exonuclease III